MWRIVNEGILEQLDPENPSYFYDCDIDFLGRTIPVTMEVPSLPTNEWELGWWHGIRIKADVDPNWIGETSGEPRLFTYTIYANSTAWFFTYSLDNLGTILPASLQYVEGSSKCLGPGYIDLDNWDPADLVPNEDPVIDIPNLTLWEDGTPTWNEIASSINIAANGNVTLSGTPGAPATRVYNFDGVTTANDGQNGNPIAIEHDSDVFPWTSSGSQNDSATPDDSEYANISADNSAEWATDDPGYNDEMAITYRFFIEEDISTITNVEIRWNGNTDGASSNNHSIWLRKDGFDEFGGTNTWVQLGQSLSIPPDVDTDLVRSLTSDFSTYINADTGQLEFVVATGRSSEDMRTNYVQVEVTYQSMTYDTPGSLTSTPIAPSELNQWYEFSWDDTEPANTDIKYYIEYYDGETWQLIPDADLPGNSTGFDTSPVDLAGLDVFTYPRIRLKADLSTTDTAVTPVLQQWQVSSVGADQRRRLTWNYVPDMDIGPGKSYILTFQAIGNPDWGIHYIEPWVSIQEQSPIYTGPTGAVAISMYNVLIEDEGQTIQAVIAITESGEVKLVSYQIMEEPGQAS